MQFPAEGHETELMETFGFAVTAFGFGVAAFAGSVASTPIAHAPSF